MRLLQRRPLTTAVLMAGLMFAMPVVHASAAQVETCKTATTLALNLADDLSTSGCRTEASVVGEEEVRRAAAAKSSSMGMIATVFRLNNLARSSII